MNTTLHRREILSLTTCSALAALAPAAPGFLLDTARAAEAPSTDSKPRGEQVLVVVQLSGGNDGLNTVIPIRHDEYRKARPTLAQSESSGLKLNDELALHPALSGFASLWESQALTIVQGVGYPNPNRSHFESFDIWHTAEREPKARSTGWLGRWSDAVGAGRGADPGAIHVGAEVQPLALAANHGAASSFRSMEDLRLRQASGPALRDEALARASAGSNESDDFRRFLRATTVGALSTSQRVEAVLQRAATPAKYPGSELATRLQTVARLIDAGLSTRVYYVVQDGYDTHSKQGPAHTALLGDLGGALQAFHADLTQRGQAPRVVTLVFSEFGRRVRENASQGTDHGAAAPLFVIGAPVRGGVVGPYPSLTDLDDGDLKHQYDFRQVYSTLLDQWLACDPVQVLGRDYARLDLLKG